MMLHNFILCLSLFICLPIYYLNAVNYDNCLQICDNVNYKYCMIKFVSNDNILNYPKFKVVEYNSSISSYIDIGQDIDTMVKCYFNESSGKLILKQHCKYNVCPKEISYVFISSILILLSCLYFFVAQLTSTKLRITLSCNS